MHLPYEVHELEEVALHVLIQPLVLHFPLSEVSQTIIQSLLKVENANCQKVVDEKMPKSNISKA